MKALRIVLTQSKAHYRKEESVTNKMTYPLPPFSTVIGALHKACNFKEYQPMDLSIQGSFASLVKQPYTDYCFLDSVMDDRGLLVKLKASDLQCNAFDKVAEAVSSKGNSFRNNITIQIYNQMLIDEYIGLKNLNDQLDEFKKNRLAKIYELFKKRKKTISEKKKQLDKKSDEYLSWDNREKEIKAKEKLIEDRFNLFKKENYTDKISAFTSLTTSLRFYEVLHDVKLIIHVKSDDTTLSTIKENIYNLKAIGRSEDFVDVIECEYAEFSDRISKEVKSQYSAYLSYDSIKEETIFLNEKGSGISASGTKYWLNKNYDRNSGKRVFDKKTVVYASNHVIEEISNNVLFDGNYIVNFC